MTCAGARGDTARQMEQTLHFDQSKTGLHELFGRLDAALKTPQGSNELRIANSLWPQEKYPFREEFLDLPYIGQLLQMVILLPRSPAIDIL